MITNQELWDNQVEVNTDDYGKACVDVARRVMEILDEDSGEFDPHKLLCRADKDVKAGGISGFMAGCVAQLVSQCHSRGEEFRKKWNKDFGVDDDKKGVVNPAILTMKG